MLAHHGFAGHFVSELWARGAVYWLAYPFLQGFVGVHLFLVVSGFCIHGRAAREDPDRNPGFASFWRRRLRRLYPPYLAAVGLTVLALALLAGLAALGVGTSTGADQGQGSQPLWITAGRLAQAGVVHLLLLFPFFPQALGDFGNPVFWTLALEEQLYLMYFALPWLRRRWGMEATVGAVFLVTIAWRMFSILGPLGHGAPAMSTAPMNYVAVSSSGEIQWIALGPARWFEWALGALAVELAFGRVKWRPIYASWAVALLAAAAAMACQWSRWGWVFTDPLWGMAFFVLVNRLVREDQKGRLHRRLAVRAVAAVGLFSYSLYLIHVPILHVTQTLLLRLMAWPIALPLGMLLVVPLAWWFYHRVERPAIDWSRGSSRSA